MLLPRVDCSIGIFVEGGEAGEEERVVEWLRSRGRSYSATESGGVSTRWN